MTSSLIEVNIIKTSVNYIRFWLDFGSNIVIFACAFFQIVYLLTKNKYKKERLIIILLKMLILHRTILE